MIAAAMRHPNQHPRFCYTVILSVNKDSDSKDGHGS